MTIKEMILPLSLALLTTWAFQYFFFQKSESGTVNAPGQTSFVAPKNAQECRPLNTQVDFADAQLATKNITTDLQMDWGFLGISSRAGAIESMGFKHCVNGVIKDIDTIFAPDENQRETRCLLVALDQKTPYAYQLIDRKNYQDRVELSYEGSSDLAKIRKTFIVYKKFPKVDLQLTIAPQGSSVQPRIMYPAPVVPALQHDDLISAVLIDAKNNFTKIKSDAVDLDKGWLQPLMFGIDNRYFVHALIGDSQSFVQRAYYMINTRKQLASILEGPSIEVETQWTLSFYFGPKEISALQAVDPRLEQTLDYSGWFAPIAKFLLKILQWLYSYLKNYGLAIIVLTILMKLILFPVTFRSEQGMKQRGEVQKKLAYVQQKYKHDPELLARERAEIIRTHGMPGLAGCLPLLLQIPMFIALSRLLASSIELYQAPFLWIKDLSAKDPYYILPLLITLGMLAQSTTADSQQRTSIVVMAFVFGAVAVNFSAGLALYICVSTLLGVAQTYGMKALQKR
jgi:YidC/Oxa1 family membrane protein insertase